jgi:hypothetical protein
MGIPELRRFPRRIQGGYCFPSSVWSCCFRHATYSVRRRPNRRLLFEKIILKFLSSADWKAIAGDGSMIPAELLAKQESLAGEIEDNAAGLRLRLRPEIFNRVRAAKFEWDQMIDFVVAETMRCDSVPRKLRVSFPQERVSIILIAISRHTTNREFYADIALFPCFTFPSSPKVSAR